MTLNANPNTQERNPMSPNVGNFVHDLVEMAKAMETLPQVEAELSRVRANNDILSDTVADREIAIARYKDMIEALNAKVRATEAERDDAELRFLKLDEKAHSVMGMLIDFEGKAKGARLILDPPKPQPEPEAQPGTADVGPGPSEVPPTSPSTSMELPVEASGGELDWKQGQAETSTLPPTQPSVSQGQGEVNPTAGYVSGQPPVATQDIVSEVPATKPSGPYTNKRYYDHPTYIPLWDWIDGGGTEESYLWRPSF